MSRVDGLLIQLARAERFAAAMIDDTERKKFETLAIEFQRELDSIQDPPSVLKTH
jgi:hypothetical protein